MLRRLTALVLLCLPTSAAAVDSVTGASPRVFPAGKGDVIVWVTGRGFADGLSVGISGNGIVQRAAPVVVPEAMRVDGGRGDGIRWSVTIGPEALVGLRDLTVTGADATMATGAGLLEITPALAVMPPTQPPTQPPSQPPTQPGSNPPLPEPEGPIGVDVITRASPTYAAQGEQVNLWIVGRTFVDGVTVSFSGAGMGPALVNGQPLLPKISRNIPSEQAKFDGIEYYLRVGAETPVGPVDITVVGPDGTRATGVGLFEVVAPGAVPPPAAGAGNVDVISGASPRAFRAGRNVSLWLWGKGFEPGATVVFSQPGIRPYAPAEVVKDAGNYPGFDGIRSFLVVDPLAARGPLDVTVINPNASQAIAPGVVQVIGADDAIPDENDVVDDFGPCLAAETTIEEITFVQPMQVKPGTPLPLAIVGRGFACGATVIIAGGGLRAPQGSAPRIVRDGVDPQKTTLYWDLEVTADAAVGSRDVTVVNPNNSSKTLAQAFSIVLEITESYAGDGGVDERVKQDDGVHACSTSGASSRGVLPLLLGLGLLLGTRSRGTRSLGRRR